MLGLGWVRSATSESWKFPLKFTIFSLRIKKSHRVRSTSTQVKGRSTPYLLQVESTLELGHGPSLAYWHLQIYNAHPRNKCNEISTNKKILGLESVYPIMTQWSKTLDQLIISNLQLLQLKVWDYWWLGLNPTCDPHTLWNTKKLYWIINLAS